MTVMVKPMRRNFLAPKFFITSALLLWLVVSLIFILLIPRASAQSASNVCPSKWGDEPGSPTTTENEWSNAPASGALRDVYNPSRFTNGYEICQQASGTVAYVESWGDGDWNIYTRLDPQYLPGGSSPLVSRSDISHLRYWTQAKSTNSNMLWEVVPKDQGSCGGGTQTFGSGTGLPQPSVGDKVQVTGAWVYDSGHMYKELHRLYQVKYGDGTTCTAALSP